MKDIQDKLLNCQLKKSEIMYLYCLVKSNIDNTETDIKNIKAGKSTLIMSDSLLNDYIEYLERNKEIYYYLGELIEL